jgi:hypothetical protein
LFFKAESIKNYGKKKAFAKEEETGSMNFF